MREEGAEHWPMGALMGAPGCGEARGQGLGTDCPCAIGTMFPRNPGPGSDTHPFSGLGGNRQPEMPGPGQRVPPCPLGLGSRAEHSGEPGREDCGNRPCEVAGFTASPMAPVSPSACTPRGPASLPFPLAGDPPRPQPQPKPWVPAGPTGDGPCCHSPLGAVTRAHYDHQSFLSRTEQRNGP